MPLAPPHPLHEAVVVALAAATVLAIGFGRVPGAQLNRAAVAAAGAGLMMALEGEGTPALWRSIDGNVLLLLFSLMVVNAALADAGAFRFITLGIAAGRATRTALLVALVAVAGVLSALFLNDTVVLMLTPSVVALARRLEASPLPYLLALAMAANAGSLATLTGNPQNVAVGLASGIDYLAFATALAPVAALSLAVVAGTILLLFRGEFTSPARAAAPATRPSVRPAALALSGLVTGAMLVAFVLGAVPTDAALVAAVLTLLLAGRGGGGLLRRVDFELLVLFAGLFVVVGGLGRTPVAADALTWAEHGGTFVLAAVTAVASNLLSNVPAVLLLLPAARAGSGTGPALTLAMASTLAGNLTLVGSVANLIVAETARRLGVEVGFAAYARVGVPVTVITLALGTFWLAIR